MLKIKVFWDMTSRRLVKMWMFRGIQDLP